MNSKVPILYVDIEGGWGGSSRSLYYAIKNIDRGRYEPVVIHGKRGPVERLYSEMGVPAYFFSPIPRTTAIPRNNLKSLAKFALELFHLPRFLAFAGRVAKRHKIRLIHLNHESLFFIAVFFRILFGRRLVMHVRTMLPKNVFGRLQVCMARKTADHLIFITENERDLWEGLCPAVKISPRTVMHNIYEQDGPVKKNGMLSGYGDRFKLATLSTISYIRGIDRLVEVAGELKKAGSDNVLFAVFGDDRPDNEYLNGIKRSIDERGLGRFFFFGGYQERPEPALAECDALIHLSRESNPWGRNVIEAMINEKPVIAVGTYDKFVGNGENGYLLPAFDAAEVAGKIVHLSSRPDIVDEMGKASGRKGKAYFDVSFNISKLEAVYESLTAGK